MSPEASLILRYFELAPEETAEFTYTYEVTQDDVDAGKIVNTVTANATAVRGDDPEEVEAKATVTALQDPSISIEKTITSAPGNGEWYVLGETIEYEITVENDGNLTVKDITVTDELVSNNYSGDFGPTEKFTLAPGESKTVTASYVVTLADVQAGSVTNTAAVSGTAANKDKVKDSAEVEADTGLIEIEITAASDSKEYDGDPLTNDGYDLTDGELADGNEIDSVTVTGSQTDAGTSPNVASDAKIVDSNGTNVTAAYDIEYVDGELEVTPYSKEITVTITGKTGSYTYDGEEKTVEGYDVEIDNDLYTEDDFEFSGTASVSETNAGTYPMGLASDQFTNISENFENVKFVVTDGELDIGKGTLTITADDTGKTYGDADPSKLTATVKGLVNGETLPEDFYTVSRDAGEDVGKYVIHVNLSSKKRGPTKAGSTFKADNYDITTEDGTFTIEPATLRLRSLRARPRRQLRPTL